MRLIKQVVLYFQEGNSDKVYEVDLCEAGEGEFVVNFRYGRRGATLREGTKTTFPVSQAEAEQIYDKLVDSKTRKGYSASTSTSASASTPAAAPGEEAPALVADPRAKRVLQYLKSAAEGNTDPAEDWKLSRILWRAGEIGLREAAPHLVKIAGTGDAMHDLSLAFALGRCGDADCSAALQDLQGTTQSAPAKRFAEAALIDFNDPGTIKAVRDRLPASLSSVIEAEADKVTAAAQEAIQRTEGAQDLLFDLYLLAPRFAGARAALREALRGMPFQHNTFKPVRYIYKVAEMRRDAEVFGWLAYRFEKTRETYRADYGVWHDGKWQPISEIMSKPDPGLAYSYNTRQYFRRRSIRTLLHLAELGLDDYAEMAAGALVAFDDAFDKKDPRKDVQWQWQRGGGSTTIDTWYDVYDYPLINHLLYANSTRYEAKGGIASWPCVDPYRPGEAAPNVREEACPEIWDRNPDAVLRLLRGSRCFAVQEFAVRVFRANPGFAERVDIPALIDILGSPFEITAELAMELAQRLYDPANPNLELVAALATCPSQPARALALGWIQEKPQAFYTDAGFLQAALLSPWEDLHRALRIGVPQAGASPETLNSAAQAVITRMLALDANEENNALVRETGETLLAVAAEPLSRMDIAAILPLLDHPIDELQAFAGKLLVNHQTPAAELDDAVFDKLLNAESAAARKVGVELFGSLPDEVLVERYAVLAGFATSKREELRQSVQPIIARLAEKHEAFARDMLEQCYPLLARKERYEGLHDDIYALLTGPLGAHLSVIPSDHIDKLLDSSYTRAQELGARLMEQFVDISQVPMRRLVQLGSHELVAVRKRVQQAYTDDPGRIKYELEEAVRLVDATWDDTRDFAFQFFREQLDESDWNPDVLVAVADSVKKPVQAFGRELITKFFDEQQGQTYLLKLSQHPSPNLQLFASNYLERFAADNLKRLQALELFFITVLCQVNRGRVAKDRVLAFLRGEALKNEEAARIVLRILHRQSATMAIGDKATCIATLRELQQAWPKLDVPLTVKPPPILEAG